jgi:hypothetical protein
MTMSKRPLSSQRYLQQREELITPKGKKGRREWVISRSLCHYRLFSLSDIPNARRENVLQMKLQQWSPFAESGCHYVWQDDQVHVWIWDKQQQQNLQKEVGLKTVQTLPETVLLPCLAQDGIQLLQCFEGFEGQIWKKGLLVGSRWWNQMPEPKQWVNFQRRHGLAATDNVPPPIEEALLDRPWGKTKRSFTRFNVFHERIWVSLGAVIFTALLTWQTVSLLKLQQAQGQVQTQINELNEDIAPILASRTQTLADKQQLDLLLGFNPHPTQLELITKVAEQLPLKEAKLVEWFFQNNELRFTVEAKKIDPTFYVKLYQKIPLFKEVNATTKTGRYKAKQIMINVQL